SLYTLHDNLHLHSFPTRRSSDLNVPPEREMAFFKSKSMPIPCWPMEFTVNVKELMVGVPDAVKVAAQMELFGQLHLRGDFNGVRDRKSTRLNSSHVSISYAVFCL